MAECCTAVERRMKWRTRTTLAFELSVAVESFGGSSEHGVLTVTVPKEEVKKQDVKSIEIEFVHFGL